MTVLQRKIDFAVVFTVNKANPNGDPLNGNRPRQDFNGYGEVSDVAIKRKIRNRLQDEGESILVQPDERRSDAYRSIKERVDSIEELKSILKNDKRNGNDEQTFTTTANDKWYDVRAFGQVFGFKGVNASIGIRGPVSIHAATSVETVDISTLQITKSVNGVTNTSSPGKKTDDTMGMKHRVDFGVYVFYGSINPQLAERTGFTDEDAQKLKEVLKTLFANDASSARPDGSMEVNKVFWWEHQSKLGQYSTAAVHRSIQVKRVKDDLPMSIQNYEITAEKLEGLAANEYAGL